MLTFKQFVAEGIRRALAMGGATVAAGAATGAVTGLGAVAGGAIAGGWYALSGEMRKDLKHKSATKRRSRLEITEAKKPGVWYHGTPHADKIRDGGFKKGWTHLSSSKPVADSYQKWARGGTSPDTLKTNLKLSNPAYYDAKGQKYTDIAHRIYYAADDAQRAGHDGLIIKNVRDHSDSSVHIDPHDSAIVFDPKNIHVLAKKRLKEEYLEEAPPPGEWGEWARRMVTADAKNASWAYGKAWKEHKAGTPPPKVRTKRQKNDKVGEAIKSPPKKKYQAALKQAKKQRKELSVVELGRKVAKQNKAAHRKKYNK